MTTSSIQCPPHCSCDMIHVTIILCMDDKDLYSSSMQRALFQGQLSLGHAAVMHDQSVISVTTPLETRWRCIMFIFLTNICLLLDAAIFEEITRRHEHGMVTEDCAGDQAEA